MRAVPRAFILALSAMPFLATASAAQSVLSFEIIAPTVGTIAYNGLPNGPLTGTGIDINLIVSVDTPANDGVGRTCVSCVMNFTTGGFTGSTATTWDFAGGGTITITGGVDLDNDSMIGAGDVPLGTTLLQGSFDPTPQVLAISGSFRILGAPFSDTKSPLLTAFFGLPNAGYQGAINLSFNDPQTPPNGFTAMELLSGNVLNQANDVPTLTPTLTRTRTSTRTPTASPSLTPTLTSTPSATATSSRTQTPSVTPTLSVTATASTTPTNTATPSRTTEIVQETPTPTTTATRTRTATATRSVTATNTSELIEETPTPQIGIDLAIEKQFSGSCWPNRSAQYIITVRNLGETPAPGPIVVSDTLPMGLTLTSAAGIGWNCAASVPPSQVSCTFAGPLAGETATVITIDFLIDAAAGQLVNTASVSSPTGAGELDLENNVTTNSTLCGAWGTPAVEPGGLAIALLLLAAIAFRQLRRGRASD